MTALTCSPSVLDPIADGWNFQAAFTRELDRDHRDTLRRDYLNAVADHPAYRDTLGHRGPLLGTDDWNQLPIIDKSWVSRHFAHFADTCGLSPSAIETYVDDFDLNRTLDDFLVFHSSGSSGVRSYSLYSLYDFGRSLFALHNRTLRPYDVDHLAYIGLLDRYNGGNQWMHHLKPYLPVTMINIFDPIDAMAETLVASRAQALFTKPSILCRLADYGRQHGVRFPAVKHLISVGENLSMHQSETIADFFGVIPLNSFSTTETGPIGFQDDPDHRVLSLYNDLNQVDIVDTRGRPIREAGVPGSLVVSNLYNTRFPLLRYDLQDVVEWVPGQVGKQISFVKGRSAKTLHFFDDAERINELTLWEFDHDAMLACQFHQPDAERLTIDVVARRDDLSANTLRDAVARHLRTAGMTRIPDVQVRFVDAIPPDPTTSKVKRLITS